MTGSETGWTVEVWTEFGWSEWTSWVDRATADVERQNAVDEGYRARVVRAK